MAHNGRMSLYLTVFSFNNTTCPCRMKRYYKNQDTMLNKYQVFEKIGN